MALQSQSIKNLKGGISQQPDILRFPNQGQTQINGWSSETQGLQKRPPTVFVKRLGFGPGEVSKMKFHLINRDEVEQYYLAFSGPGLAIWDLQGNSYAVRGWDSYAVCDNPRQDLRVITVADYTFVTNRKVVARESATLTHSTYTRLKGRALVNVRGGQYGRTLSITINGDGTGASPQATLVMPNGSAEKVPAGQPYAGMDQVAMTDATWIANELKTKLATAMGPAGWTFSSGAGWLLINAPVGTDIANVVTADGYGDQLLSAIVYQSQSFTKLPAQAPDGYIVEITGESARTGDNYWVKFSTSAKGWAETVSPFIVDGMDPATLPHALVRAPDGAFDWITLPWDKRNAGDNETNPLPSFRNETINDVFFFRNRLGFLSGENVILSRPGKFFNFFPASVAVLSDDDPIDVSISHNRVSILKYAVPFAEQLLLWSDQAQFVLKATGILSAKTAELSLTTQFDVSDGARPFGIGRGVYFAAPRASYTSLKRYFAVQDVSDVKSAEDVSAHVPSYIKNTVHSIHGSGTENFVTMLSDGDPSKLFIYKFLYMDERLVQQSFSHWYFGTSTIVRAACCVGSYAYLVIERPEGLCLERMEFTENTTDIPVEPYRTYMDMKKVVTLGAYDPDLGETLVNVFDIYGGVPAFDAKFYAVAANGKIQTFEGPWTVDSKLHFTGNRAGEDVAFGKAYEFEYEFSKLLIKNQSDDGTVSTEDTGRLQLRRAWVNYQQSGPFDVFVNNGSTTYEYRMAGARIGPQSIIGVLNLGSGQFPFPVPGNALYQRVTVKSDFPTPLGIIGAGWEGNYIRRTSGI